MYVNTHTFILVQRLESEMDAIMGAGAAAAATAAGSASWLGGGPSRGFLSPSASAMSHVDGEMKRADAYSKALEVDSLLHSASGALAELVSRVNVEFERQREEPLEQIRSILDSQMASLAFVEREASILLQEARNAAAHLSDASAASYSLS